eukprot:TRINITY_DN3298_c1_g1_i1.p1 TRINITY_DN3298_c1_g1~~TRINITY_DN3298_c1_g1_i1.p1  ORF type:complete len:183 (-),score=28.22 TRINITY_DN3298_c1_g1_i1:197-745(-)
MVPLTTQFQEDCLRSEQRHSLLADAVQKMMQLQDGNYQTSLSSDGGYEKVVQGIKAGRELKQLRENGVLFTTICEHDVCLLEPLIWKIMCSLIAQGKELEIAVILRILKEQDECENTDLAVLRAMLTKLPISFPRLYFFYVGRRQMTPGQTQYIVPVQFLQELCRQKLEKAKEKENERWTMD